MKKILQILLYFIFLPLFTGILILKVYDGLFCDKPKVVAEVRFNKFLLPPVFLFRDFQSDTVVEFDLYHEMKDAIYKTKFISEFITLDIENVGRQEAENVTIHLEESIGFRVLIETEDLSRILEGVNQIDLGTLKQSEKVKIRLWSSTWYSEHTYDILNITHKTGVGKIIYFDDATGFPLWISKKSIKLWHIFLAICIIILLAYFSGFWVSCIRAHFKGMDGELKLIKINENARNELSINKVISDGLRFIMKIKLFSNDQDLRVYYLFETSMNERKWIGYTNIPNANLKTDKEFTQSLSNIRKKNYLISSNITDTIRSSFPDLRGKPAKICKIAYKAENALGKPIQLIYGFQDK